MRGRHNGARPRTGEQRRQWYVRWVEGQDDGIEAEFVVAAGRDTNVYPCHVKT